MEDILNDFYDSPLPASKLIRWLASFIDYLACFFVSGGILYFLDDRAIPGDAQRLIQLKDIAGILAIFLPWLLLLPGMETMNGGKTLGKSIFQIKAVKPDGSKID